MEKKREDGGGFPLAARTQGGLATQIAVSTDVVIGGSDVVIIAGPCAVESWEIAYDTAVSVQRSGAHVLRGGAFKPRTSPYAFQGLGEEGIAYLRRLRTELSIPIITEVLTDRNIGESTDSVDIFQIGARNMQNFPLLRTLGSQSKPVLLKRGFGNTVEEWLHSAEYIMMQGNHNVILCERGIRTFEDGTRNTLDISAVAAVKELSHLPIVVDPSHATGRASFVAPMARAAVAAGADGVMIEVHPHPEFALCDGDQALRFDEFTHLVNEIAAVAAAIGRGVKSPSAV